MIIKPEFIYGTAWKEEKTEELVIHAIKAGFRAIDTACQRRHYFEAGVGNALAKCFEDNLITRQELFLQTKYTYSEGQDNRLPYDIHVEPKIQVQQSLNTSLANLKTPYLDSYILHGPKRSDVLTETDAEVWKEMENIQKRGIARVIGVSNINIHQLKALYSLAEVKPSYVQNRCYARMKWDAEVREFCRENGIIYQGFSLLTANRNEIANPQIIQLSEKYHKTIPQIIFRFSKQIGIIPLTGTTNPENMKDDLNIQDFEITPDEARMIEEISLI